MRPARARLHLFALSSFAVAQPLYDLIGRNAEFLVAHRAGPGTIAALIAVLSFGVPAVLVALAEMLARFSPRVGWLGHLALVCGLVALTAAAAVRGLSPPFAITVAAACGAAAAALYRVAIVRTFLTVITPAVVIFPLVFVLLTPVGRLAAPRRAQYGAAALRHTPPIVVVVFDELDTYSLLDADGGIAADRFPHFAALATTATWFPNAIAAFPYTQYALPAMVTGVAPDASSRRLPTAADYADNLFTWLGTSYVLHVSEPLTSLCPPSLCPPGSRGTRVDPGMLATDVSVLYLHLITPKRIAAERLPPLTFTWKGFAAAPRQAAARPAPRAPTPPSKDWDVTSPFVQAMQTGRDALFREFVQQIERQPRPVLHFVHTLLPHAPYQYLASGREYPCHDFPTGLGGASGAWSGSLVLADTGRQRHMEQARFVDRLLGELLARLKSEGLFDDALVIVTSDHGAAFQPGHSHRELRPATSRGIMAAVALVKLPGQRTAATDERRFSGLDIVPTIAHALGTTVPWSVDGQSIYSANFPERATVEYKGLKLPPLPTFDVRAEAMRTKLRLPEDLTALRQALTGRPVDALKPQPHAAGLRILSTSFRDFETTPSSDAAIPALVHGRIVHDGRTSGPLRLAIAVDGVIREVTETGPWEGEPHYFATLLPESAFAAGPNRVDVFLVDGTLNGIRLARLSPGVSAGVKIQSRAAGEYLVTGDGKELSLTNDQVFGSLDRVDTFHGGLILHGWALDRAARPLEAVVAFANGAEVATARPNGNRPDVTDAHRLPSGTKVGYAVYMRREDLRDPDTLRLFGISDRGVAGEVRISPVAIDALRRLIQPSAQVP